jgi:peptide/nickel transport system substrate-binding protein
VTLHLRSGVRWHDDRPFGPMDVQATFEAVQRSTSRAPLLRTLLGEVLAVEIAPERQVRLRLSRPSGYVLRALCDLPILPEPALRGGVGPLSALGRAPIGTGPFRFSAWERGKRIKLQKNRQGWGEPAAIDEIVFEIDGDGTRALTRTRRGEIDVLPRLLESHYPEQVGPAALGDRLSFVRLSPARYSFVAVNHDRPPLGDVRFRRALSLLWNREALADAHHGLAHPIAGPPFGAATAPRFAPKEAARLLDEAGYRDTNGDGVREREGRPIRLTILQPAGSRPFARAAKSFALELRKAGLLLDLATVDPATLGGRMERGEFDLAPARWEGAPDEDPRPLFGPGGEHNVARYRSDRAHALLEALRTADGPAARAPLLARFAAVLADELPVLFLYRHEQAVIVSRRVQGLAGPAGRLDLRRVWLDP